ncbi:MAG: glycosyltransferase family 4 protein [bacterium]
MKVVVSAGGRFHAINLAQQLNKKNCLQKLYSFSFTKSDQHKIDKNNGTSISLVKTINSCKFLDMAFQKLRIAHFINPSVFNSFKDNLFDSLVAREIKKLEHINIFTGWANYSLKCLTQAKKIGAKTIIESGSCHIKEQQLLLSHEYEKWGLTFKPIHQPTIDKMVEEYNQADYIMTLSDFSYQSFIKHGINPKKILKSPCGIDVDFFQTKETLTRQDTKFRVIFVGMISVRKGIPYLIEAWNKLNLPENSTELIFVGNIQKDMYQVLKKLEIKKNINFFGSCSRDNLKKLYHESNVFVLPSVEDGFGMVIGEAMACELPVICSKNTGANEIIQDGKHGFLVPAQNAEALAEKILWCYQNPKLSKEMGNFGKNKILDFSWDNYGDNVFEIYQNIMRDNR